MFSEDRRLMSRSNERLGIRRNLAGCIAERASELGIERFADPYENSAAEEAQSSDQRVEDL